VWIVDRGPGRVLRFAGAASRTSGSAAADSSFALDADNAGASDLVTDGTTLWVIDDVKDAVFVYDTAGARPGRWQLDASNGAPSGITLNPAGGTDLWVLDRADRLVYRYANATTRLAGSQTASETFALAAADTQPEGIADPPGSQPSLSILTPSD